MLIYNITTLSNKDLKKLANEFITLDDVYDECDECRRPGIEVVAKNWRDLKRRLKLILKEIKIEMKKKKKRTCILTE